MKTWTTFFVVYFAMILVTAISGQNDIADPAWRFIFGVSLFLEIATGCGLLVCGIGYLLGFFGKSVVRKTIYVARNHIRDSK